MSVPVPHATDVLPTDADLPGTGWMAIDEGFGSAGDGADSPGALFDCVGPGFPDGDEVIETAGTPHYVRPPGSLLHGFGVLVASDDAAERAERILSAPAFAECLGRSVAADLAAGDATAELLAVDHEATGLGHRVRFTGGTVAGVRPVELDVICLRRGRAVGLLWFADTPEPFPTDAVEAVVERIRAR